MSDIKISLDSSAAEGAISVVRVDGVVDTMTAPELEKIMNSLLEQRKFDIIIDLGGVDYISSAGWGIFISNIREIRQNNGDIKLARMIPNVYEIFELLEFDSILRAYDSIEKAKSDFSGISAESKTAFTAVSTKTQNSPGNSDTSDIVTESMESSDIKKDEVRDLPGEPFIRQSGSKIPKLYDVVIELISKDPFYTISEMNSEISRKYPKVSAGWWKIWAVLRKNGLLKRKNRFRFARNKSGKS